MSRSTDHRHDEPPVGGTGRILCERFHPVGRPPNCPDVVPIAGPFVPIQTAAEDGNRVLEVVAEDGGEFLRPVDGNDESIEQYGLSRERVFERVARCVS